AKGPSGNKVCILARAPGGQMRGAATQAMPVCIVEERQQSRCTQYLEDLLRGLAERHQLARCQWKSKRPESSSCSIAL
ncbi:MAG TPA: hypothetical protein VKL19_12735, partial [Thermoanaerobaculia bacterium]|nr:hypothetical protein [Thermoanaerobaculia bacterium]